MHMDVQDVPGIGPATAKKLAAAGVKGAKALAKLPSDATVDGLSAKQLAGIIVKAQAAVGEPTPKQAAKPTLKTAPKSTPKTRATKAKAATKSPKKPTVKPSVKATAKPAAKTTAKTTAKPTPPAPVAMAPPTPMEAPTTPAPAPERMSPSTVVKAVDLAASVARSPMDRESDEDDVLQAPPTTTGFDVPEPERTVSVPVTDASTASSVPRVTSVDATENTASGNRESPATSSGDAPSSGPVGLLTRLVNRLFRK